MGHWGEEAVAVRRKEEWRRWAVGRERSEEIWG
jgi:hypothetical protein